MSDSEIKQKKIMNRFKEYYDTHEEFRKSHNKKMCEKIQCECGFETARANLSRHRKSHIHQRMMQILENLKK
jgi:DNA topoisomerase IB